MPVFHAFEYGKMNQCFKMENENNQSLCEANITKFRLFSASDYEFVNHVTTVSTSHKIGKTKSISEGHAGINMATASYFTLDGKNCFDILKEKGYSINIHLKADILHPEFALVDGNGNQVAVYKMNVSGEREEGVSAIGNKQRNTVITTESEDLDAVFLGAMILTRVDFSLYLL